MEYTVNVRMNEHLFLRDPERSDLGRKIVREGITLFGEIGLEEATFRKLADRMGTKEASIYRYFENKHRLLVYLVTWYWQWLEYQVVFQTNNLQSPHEKLDRILRLLIMDGMNATAGNGADSIDLKTLHGLVIREASKAYLTRHVTEDNRQQLFKPYKDLCARIANVIREHQPTYPFARSLASTLIETAHYQAFFRQNLPSLTDFDTTKDETQLLEFLRHLLFSTLEKPT
ncbi:MAG: TetR/AcrR family transcriptional regulator [Rudanella sp.]|nr:TetR/AcrR family transcriptional regulator [Rudanella sp.]